MNSKFDQKTSEGIYTFNQDEIFEALTIWCKPKGITLDKNSVKAFASAQTDSGFVIEMSFNHRSKKED